MPQRHLVDNSSGRACRGRQSVSHRRWSTSRRRSSQRCCTRKHFRAYRPTRRGAQSHTARPSTSHYQVAACVAGRYRWARRTTTRVPGSRRHLSRARKGWSAEPPRSATTTWGAQWPCPMSRGSPWGCRWCLTLRQRPRPWIAACRWWCTPARSNRCTGGLASRACRSCRACRQVSPVCREARHSLQTTTVRHAPPSWATSWRRSRCTSNRRRWLSGATRTVRCHHVDVTCPPPSHPMILSYTPVCPTPPCPPLRGWWPYPTTPSSPRWIRMSGRLAGLGRRCPHPRITPTGTSPHPTPRPMKTHRPWRGPSSPATDHCHPSWAPGVCHLGHAPGRHTAQGVCPLVPVRGRHISRHDRMSSSSTANLRDRWSWSRGCHRWRRQGLMVTTWSLTVRVRDTWLRRHLTHSSRSPAGMVNLTYVRNVLINFTPSQNETFSLTLMSNELKS